jgi:hypothetical protein
MGAPGSAPPGLGTEAQESTDAGDPLDAMDGPDDDGSGEPEEMQSAAAAPMEALQTTPSHEASVPAVTNAAPSHAAPPETTPSHAAPTQTATPHVDAAPAAPVPSEPAPGPAATPDRADHDPQ